MRWNTTIYFCSTSTLNGPLTKEPIPRVFSESWQECLKRFKIYFIYELILKRSHSKISVRYLRARSFQISVIIYIWVFVCFVWILKYFFLIKLNSYSDANVFVPLPSPSRPVTVLSNTVPHASQSVQRP